MMDFGACIRIGECLNDDRLSPRGSAPCLATSHLARDGEIPPGSFACDINV